MEWRNFEEGVVATWRSYPGAQSGRGNIVSLGERGGDKGEGVMAEPYQI